MMQSPNQQVTGMFRRNAYRAVLLCIVIIAVCAFVISYLQNQESCTVGVVGTSTNITFTGTYSNNLCNSDDSYSNFYYDYKGTPTGNEICSGAYTRTISYVVRDGSPLNYVGLGFCDSLRQNAQTQ